MRGGLNNTCRLTYGWSIFFLFFFLEKKNKIITFIFNVKRITFLRISSIVRHPRPRKWAGHIDYNARDCIFYTFLFFFLPPQFHLFLAVRSLRHRIFTVNYSNRGADDVTCAFSYFYRSVGQKKKKKPIAVLFDNFRRRKSNDFV